MADQAPGGDVFWKVGLRLLPFLFLLYVVNILDRVNLGFAKLGMLHDLGLEGDEAEAAYGLGFGIFYIGYLAFEVPSNLILHRVGARAWIGRIMVSWGIVSAAMLFVSGPWGLYALRFLLGVAEAGFFPGIILYLSYWFPARLRGRAVAVFMLASPTAGAVGNPLSGAILQYLSGAGGLAGWQWLFLVEGVPAVVLGVWTWFYLTDRPWLATWLTPAEREWLTAQLEDEAKQREERHGLSRLSALAHPRVALLVALYFTAAVASNGFGSYAPTIIKEQFSDVKYFGIGLLAAVPNVVAVAAMLLAGAHSDSTGERRRHVAGAALLGAAGWLLAALAHDPWIVLLGLVLAQVGVMCMLPTFWALATSLLSGTAAAGGIALINSLANLGGFLGPNLIAQLKTGGADFTGGMLAMGLTLTVGAALALAVRHDPSHDRA
jgi:MFS family permease